MLADDLLIALGPVAVALAPAMLMTSLGSSLATGLLTNPTPAMDWLQLATILFASSDALPPEGQKHTFSSSADLMGT
jgi:hypothetical protein